MGYQGPCSVYLTRTLICSENRTCRIDIGHSDSFELWLNNEKLTARQGAVWWTNENVHLNRVRLKKGANHLAVRLNRHSTEALFSLCFLRCEDAQLGPISYPEHIVDMADGIPEQ